MGLHPVPAQYRESRADAGPDRRSQGLHRRSGLPDPDLFIRTGGEQRVSNFLLWNLAYTELYFCEALWPDFDAQQLAAALEFFSQRQRRFGLTQSQAGAGP